VAKVTDRQPLGASFVKEAVASRVPDALHRLPVCVPVLAAPL
jgi:hypothetical protein